MASHPNGANINSGVGSTAPEACIAKVLETGAHAGIALDGDADRVHVIDEKGQVVDGDQILALIARRWMQADRLAHGGVVATVMSNMGLERHLEDTGVFSCAAPP